MLTLAPLLVCSNVYLRGDKPTHIQRMKCYRNVSVDVCGLVFPHGIAKLCINKVLQRGILVGIGSGDEAFIKVSSTRNVIEHHINYR